MTLTREGAIAELERRKRLSAQSQLTREGAIAELRRREMLAQQEQKEPKSFMQRGYEYLNEPRFELGATGSALRGIEEAIGSKAHGILQPVLESGYLGEGIKQASKDVARERLERYLEAKQNNPIASVAGNIAGEVGAALPLAAGLPLAAAKMGMSTGFLPMAAATGAASGASEYVHPNQSRFMNTLIGGGLGAATAGVVKGGAKAWQGISKAASGASKTISKHLGGKKDVAKDVFRGLPENEVADMLEAQAAGQRLGVNLTPAEASGNPLLAKTEGKFGVTPETEQALYEFKKGQKSAQKEAVEKFKTEISSSEDVANSKAREAAKNIIEKKRQRLQQKARPYYEKSEKQVISKEQLADIMKDSNIMDAYKKVLSDPLYQTELEGFDRASIKVLDQVKKRLDSKRSSFLSQGEREEARIIKKSQQKLINALDEVSPDYKTARAIYSEESPNIKALEDSKIGKIANLGDEKTKNISKTIFDPAETDMKTFLKVRNEMLEESPETWRRVVRDEMERRLDSSKSLPATQNYGSEFYSNILARDKDFKKFYEALGDPKSKTPTPEQLRLSDMRKAFKGLINSVTGKTAAGQSKTFMTSTGRGGYTGKVVDFYNELTKGKYDKAAIEIITDKDWKKYLPSDVKKAIKTDSPQNPNQLMNMLIAVEASKASSPGVLTNLPYKEKD
jgi:hypothetical protein